MDVFYDKFNIIEQILKNDPMYTILTITSKNVKHYNNFKKLYHKKYNNKSYCSIIFDSLTKNDYIDELDIQGIIFDCSLNILKLLQKPYKSIYMFNYGHNVLDCLINTKNSTVEKLKVNPLQCNGKIISNFITVNKSLKNLALAGQDIEHDMSIIMKSLNNSNIETLSLERLSLRSIPTDMIINIIDTCTKIKNLYLYDRYTNNVSLFFDSLSKNFNIIDFEINNIKCNKINEILERNKKYFMTIFMCVNKRIIPKCVSMNLIIPYINS